MNVEPFPTFSGDCRLAKTCFNPALKTSVKRVPHQKEENEGTRLTEKPAHRTHAQPRVTDHTHPAHATVHAGKMQTIQIESFADDLTDQAITLIPVGEQIPHFGIADSLRSNRAELLKMSVSDLSISTPYNGDTKKLNALRSRQEVARSPEHEVLLP